MTQKSKLRVIKIIDPILCVRCDCAYVADVVTANGKRKKMFYCSRLDCDNWLTTPAQTNDADIKINNIDISNIDISNEDAA